MPNDAANAAQFAEEINKIIPILRVALRGTQFRDDAMVSAIMVFAGELFREQKFPSEHVRQMSVDQCIALFRMACDRAGPAIYSGGRA